MAAGQAETSASDTSVQPVALQQHDELVEVEEREAGAGDVRVEPACEQRRSDAAGSGGDGRCGGRRRCGAPGTVTISAAGASSSPPPQEADGSSTCSSTSLQTATRPTRSRGRRVGAEQVVLDEAGLRHLAEAWRTPSALSSMPTSSASGAADGGEQVARAAADVEDALGRPGQVERSRMSSTGRLGRVVRPGRRTRSSAVPVVGHRRAAGRRPRPATDHVVGAAERARRSRGRRRRSSTPAALPGIDVAPPVADQRAGGEVDVRGARRRRRSCPGGGLRHVQASTSSWGQTTTSSIGRSRDHRPVDGVDVGGGARCPGRCRAGW